MAPSVVCSPRGLPWEAVCFRLTQLEVAGPGPGLSLAPGSSALSQLPPQPAWCAGVHRKKSRAHIDFISKLLINFTAQQKYRIVQLGQL